MLADLLDARARAERITGDLAGEQLLGPKLAIVNPPLWEIGHVSWFQERWCLRLREDGSLGDSILAGADALYDSSAVAHDTRWGLKLPDLAATREYGEAVLDLVRERMEREPGNARLAYFVRLVTFHEDMHAEAFHYTRHTLGYSDPVGVEPDPVENSGDAELRGGPMQLGAPRGDAFVFDNEKWGHEVKLAPFRVARGLVTAGEFLRFAEAGGAVPKYWKKQGNAWLERRFDRWRPLALDGWAKRRLPTEAEWEFAAKAGAIPGASGLWEWTATDFQPYPGFVVDPYKEYSEPWFGTHKVLRGGSFSTAARLLRPTFRNFYMPERADVFCGFRTCALG
jgi:iron(II)-dependent oxidoreductase